MPSLIRYSEHSCQQFQCDTFEEMLKLMEPEYKYWIDLELAEADALEALTAHFAIHPLILDDVLNIGHIPKFEVYENHVFLVLKMLKINTIKNEIEHEHLSLLLGENYVISFQEDSHSDVFGQVRHSLNNGLGSVRRNGSDYLFYRLTDAVSNGYKKVQEHIREQIEELELEIYKTPNQDVVQAVMDLKVDLRLYRRFVAPLREEISKMRTEPSHFLKKSTLTYFRDIQDELTDVNMTFESFREMLRDIMELHAVSLDLSMNSIMKTLTVVSTIFIPLSFVAGFYGMNFKHMPELEWPWAYPALAGGMFTFALVSAVYMWYRKWW